MADQNVTTTKEQRLAELRNQQLVPGATDIQSVADYIHAFSDFFCSVDIDDVGVGQFKNLAKLQFNLTRRLNDLLEIESMKEGAI